MALSQAIWKNPARSLIAAVLFLVAGCLPRTAGFRATPSLSPLPPLTRLLDEPSGSAPALAAPPHTFEDLIAIALRHHPDLAVARAKAESARGKLIQAGLYPNPTLSTVFGDLNSPANAVGKPGLGFSQTIVRGDKLAIAQAAAGRGVEAADFQAMTRWFEVLTRVRLAYYDLLTVRSEIETAGEIMEVSEKALAVALKLQKAGVGGEPDVLRAQVERDQSVIRRDVAQRRGDAAQRQLALAVGVRDLPLDQLTGNLKAPPPALAWEPLRHMVLERSSEILEAEALAWQAEELVRRARAENIPNFDLKVLPFYSTPDRAMMGEVALSATIPIWNQNQGNILSAQADRDRARAEVKQVELRLGERLTAAFQRYQSARLQIEAYEKKILPQAKSSVDLVEIGYKKGDAKYNYTALLQAQQVLFQAQLTYVQSLGDLWRSVAEIGGLVQDDSGTLAK